MKHPFELLRVRSVGVAAGALLVGCGVCGAEFIGQSRPGMCSAAADSGPPANEDAPPIPPGPPGGPPPPSAPCGFTTGPEPFALPLVAGAPTGAFDETSGQVACATGGRSFSFYLLDMNGDQLPDLVVDGSCDDVTVGTSALLVYPNTGKGFGASQRFALPALPTTAGCVADTFVDINGDLKPDLVVTSLCGDPTVGTSRWLVYLNGAGGFAASSQAFALPSGFGPGSFVKLEAATAVCGSMNQPAFAFFDLTGDSKPDLVVTSSCDDVSVGTSAWSLYAGNGTGVAPSPAPFPLPISPSAGQMGAFASPMSGNITCANGPASLRYALLDFDGNTTLDLMVTSACDDPTVGTTQWSVYPSSGSSFAANATSVALPVLAAAPAAALDTLGSSVACSGVAGNLAFTTVDANGDLRPDLVVTSACDDPTVGVSHWILYPNTKTGFGPAQAYTLPEITLGATTSAPAGLTGTLDCSGASSAAFVTGYLAPPSLDLIVTATCDDATVGASRWLLFAGACSG